MDFLQLQLNLLKKERNIYELADLYEQQRLSPANMLAELCSPEQADAPLQEQGNALTCSSSGKRFAIENQVVDFTGQEFEKNQDEWARLNAQFLNYHKSLSVYTLVNALPLLNYLAERSGLHELRNATVVDIGAGTGHAYCSFFRHPETLRYYLVDPNLRLLHDQFLRIYPRLAQLKMGHILSYAEKLPFKSNSADLVMSQSAIDHFKDYKQFMKESFRITKPGGQFFLSSHLDVPPGERIQRMSTPAKLFSFQFWERLARFLYYRKYQVGKDDHTWHFETIDPLLEATREAGFEIIDHEVVLGHFWIKAVKK